MLRLLRDPNFRLFFIGELVSVIGDHISLIAFPWLALQMTGSPQAAGIVLAAQGLPRAALMLAGGLMVDRFSPRAVMLITNLARGGLVVTLALLLSTDIITFPMLVALGLAFGLCDAFFYPASISILPSLVKKEDLQAGNALVQGIVSVAVATGPALAALIIAGEFSFQGFDHAPTADLTASDGYAKDKPGLTRAFYIDAASFIVSAVTLMLVRVRALDGGGEDTAAPEQRSGWAQITSVMRDIWQQKTLRLCFVSFCALEFFYQAPIFVGLPALSRSLFSEAALVYGLWVASWGSGALVGSILGGILPAVSAKRLPMVMLFFFGFSGSTLGIVTLSGTWYAGILLFFIAGVGDSFVWVQFITWLQKITPERSIGRVMSLFMVMAVGLLPVASLLMGVLAERALVPSLLGASAAIIVICLIGALHPHARRGDEVKLSG